MAAGWGSTGYYNGTSMTCALRQCSNLSAVPNGRWSYEHVAGYGSGVIGSCGSVATVTCDPCYSVQIGDASRHCVNGTAWNGTQPVCLFITGMCDADVFSYSGTNGMTVNYNYSLYNYNSSRVDFSTVTGQAIGSKCGDAVTYSCPTCSGMNVSAYPNPEENMITRTCQGNGSWTGPSHFKCERQTKSYSVNMLVTEADRSVFQYKYSPYECENNITLCADCQVNVDVSCRAEASSDPGLYAACSSIAKNPCPAMCRGKVCDACSLTPEGVTTCAVTGECLCYENAYGNGCQNDTSPLTFDISAQVCFTSPTTGVSVSIPDQGPDKLGVTLMVNLTDAAGNLVKSYPSTHVLTSAIFTLPDGLPFLQDYTLTVTAVDFLKRTLTKSTVFQIQVPALVLTIQGGSAITAVASKSLSISATATLASFCTAVPIMEYKWLVSLNPSGASLDLSSTDTASRIVAIPPNTLSVGSVYTFQMTASVTAYGRVSPASVTTTVTMAVSPLSVSLSTGSAFKVKIGTVVTFATDVVDEDGATKTYSWTVGGAAVAGAGSTSNGPGTPYVLNTGDLTIADSPVTITVTVNKLNAEGVVLKTATASSVMELSALEVPDVLITRQNSDTAFASSEYLALTSVVTEGSAACAGCTYLWSIDSPDGTTPVVLVTSLTADSSVTSDSITMQTNTSWSAGSTYTFRLTATTSSGVTGYSEVQVYVNKPPTAGSLSLLNPSGGLNASAFSTELTFNASGWYDAEPPLSYQFGYWVNGTSEAVPITSFLYVSSFSTTDLPVGTAHPYVWVRDALGAVSQFPEAGQYSTPVTVEVEVPAGSSMAEVLSGTLDSKLNQSLPISEATALFTAMADSINNAAPPTTAAALDAATSMRATMAVSLGSSLTSSRRSNALASGAVDISALMSSAASIGRYSAQLNAASQTSLSSVVQSVLAAASSVRATTGTQLVQVLANVQVAASSGGATSTAAALELTQRLTNVQKLAATTMVPGEPMRTLASNTITTYIQKHTASQMITAAPISGCQVKSLGSLSAASTYTTSVIDTALSAIPFDTAQYKDTLQATQKDFSVLHGTTGATLSVSNMANPAVLAITLTNAVAEPGCVYLDEAKNSYSSVGMSTITAGPIAAGGTVTCHSTHLTGFNVKSGGPIPLPTLKMAFTTQPDGARVGEPFDVQPVVAIQDLNGNTVSSALVVTLSKFTGPNGTLGGTTGVAAVGGLATFTGLTLNIVGDYVLKGTANAGALAVNSDSFTVAPPPTPTPTTPTSPTPTPPTPTGTWQTLSQALSVSTLSTSSYTGDEKTGYEAAYARSVSSTYYNLNTKAYISGVEVSSTVVAARRASTITFVLRVLSTVTSLSALRSLVQANSAQNFLAALQAVVNAANYSFQIPLPSAVSLAAAIWGTNVPGNIYIGSSSGIPWWAILLIIFAIILIVTIIVCLVWFAQGRGTSGGKSDTTMPTSVEMSSLDDIPDATEDSKGRFRAETNPYDSLAIDAPEAEDVDLSPVSANQAEGGIETADLEIDVGVNADTAEDLEVKVSVDMAEVHTEVNALNSPVHTDHVPELEGAELAVEAEFAVEVSVDAAAEAVDEAAEAVDEAAEAVDEAAEAVDEAAEAVDEAAAEVSVDAAAHVAAQLSNITGEVGHTAAHETAAVQPMPSGHTVAHETAEVSVALEADDGAAIGLEMEADVEAKNKI